MGLAPGPADGFRCSRASGRRIARDFTADRMRREKGSPEPSFMNRLPAVEDPFL